MINYTRVAPSLGLIALLVTSCSAPVPPYKNAALPVEDRVKDLVGRMTVEEKAAMLGGGSWMESTPVPRLGIPSIKMADGPLGVRSWAGSSAITNAQKGPAAIVTTVFPSGTAVGATWNPEIAEKQGRAVAQEAKALGRDMVLGPTVNIQRVPIWGRNFEGYGEDPYLAARLGVAYINGMQAEKVIPSVKHYAANNQEFERHRIDETISERALREIYLPAFEAAVKEAKVWAVMNAYNKVNGLYCAESPFLLKDVLKKDWGFQGFVISDWGSTYSTAPTVRAGMDLEMPGGEAARRWLALPATQKDGNDGARLTQEKVLAELKAGAIQQADIDDSVSRILRVMFQAGLFDSPKTAGGPAVMTPEHRAAAREASLQSIVLLKNDRGVLPFDAAKIHRIAVIGPAAAVAITGGGGSSRVRPTDPVAPLDGIRQRAGSGVEVDYALGVSMEGADPAKDAPAEQAKLRQEAVAAASKADAAVVMVGYSNSLESEGFDRKSMDLPAGQDALIQAVAAANRNTVVVIVAGAPVQVGRWIGRTPAVVDLWFPGQEGGHALADVLFGDASPSGKLPMSWPKELADVAAMASYPGKDLRTEYKEGVYVGYRHFDTHNVTPQFPFGYGLSYAKFDYSGLKVAQSKIKAGETVDVSLDVKNSGSREAAEVVELYVHDVKASIDRPAKELKGFRRVALKAGESKTLSFRLDASALSFWSPEKKAWVAEPGAFEVLVGASSRDIRLKGGFELTE